ncbi:MAG: chemotaxis response regulator protein-glutamate methylesterase, partial [Parvularculaceae bacterium]|nr:chemotaxis response regulator protein-glutamate methylesterase [Parvularculaceae bacterium]
AREAIKALNPDVITLDVEMPNMSGVEFLEKIMRLRPMPVVMVSTLTHKGTETAVEALRLGAVDCIGKPPNGDVLAAFGELPRIVKEAARARVRGRAEAIVSERGPANFRSDGRVVAIGSSTGGVEALLAVLSSFPENCPPTVITQHMPAGFTTSFAARLNAQCKPEVAEARDGAPLEPGKVYLAPGGATHLEVVGTSRFACRLRGGDTVSGHRPSVDVLFDSVSRSCGAAAVGVILTGMGRDGAKGLLAMREAGAETFGQDEASCVVYGMPRAAFEIGAVQRQAPIGRIAHALLSACNASARSAA